MFHKFNSQEERKNFGGSAFIEIQYCKLKPSTKLKKLVSITAIDFWRDDSLYVYYDDINSFVESYNDILDVAFYSNLKQGTINPYGINYFTSIDVELIKVKLTKMKPRDYEILLEWLEENDNYNGFYVLGV